MIEKDTITKKLKELGFKDANIDKVFADVMQIILNRALGNYLQKLPEDTRKKLGDFPENELIQYIEKNSTNLPKFSTQEFEKIHDETWESYFKSISK